MKKLISVFLAALLVLTCAVPAFAAGEEAFVPVLRFIAASDTHVRDDSDTNPERIAKMIGLGYAAAEADAAYPKLDAVLIAGDLTNDGTKTEFDRFWSAVSGSLKGDTRFIGVVAKNHDGYQMKRTEVHDYYQSLTGNTADFHVVINGYHFIGLSASDNDAVHYDKDQLKWLKQQLDEAVAEDPDRPVFVTHHEHVRGTVYGSSLYDGWGKPFFMPVLKKYPQVVDFSGHSHYPLNDPRSVWQGNFTCIGTGAIYYSEFTIDEYRAFDPADAYDTATCWIVELDAANRMRLRGYDVNEEALLCEYILENPADPANRQHTEAVKKAASKPPVFDENAALKVTSEYGVCRVTAPAAASADGMPVVLYRAYAKNKLGVTVSKTWTLPRYYRAIEEPKIDLTLEDLSSGEYTIRVVAENAYGGQSAPLEIKVTVEGYGAVTGFFRQITQWFRHIVSYIKNLF